METTAAAKESPLGLPTAPCSQNFSNNILFSRFWWGGGSLLRGAVGGPGRSTAPSYDLGERGCTGLRPPKVHPQTQQHKALEQVECQCGAHTIGLLAGSLRRGAGSLRNIQHAPSEARAERGAEEGAGQLPNALSPAAHVLNFSY